MGSGISHLIPCIRPEDAGGAAVAVENRNNHQHEVWFEAEEQLDGTLGHSFCYIPSSARFLSPTPSDRFLSPTQSFRVSPSHDRSDPKARCAGPETGFRAISGASVSANTSTPKTFFQLDGVYDDSNDFSAAGVGWLREYGSIVNGFESTSSFSALPLQPVPRGERTGTTEGGGLFLSGPIERGALSGPLDLSAMDGADNGSLPFSAPLGRGGSYAKNNNKKRRNKSFSGIKKAFQRSLSEKKRPWVVPVRNFAGRKELAGGGARDVGETQTGGGRIGAAAAAASMVKNVNDTNVQWALGKAGEDRVHVVISEEHGWLFVGIYDGFNGPDAPEFLMSHLYRAVFHELKGLFWDSEENCSGSNCNLTTGGHHGIVNIDSVNGTFRVGEVDAFDGKGISSSSDNEICVESIKENQVIPGENDRVSVKRVTFQSEKKDPKRKLWEFLAEDDAEDGLDLSGSERFAFSVDEAVSVSNAGSAVDKRTLLLSKLKQGISRKKNECGMSLFPWRLGSEVEDKIETENKVGERTSRNCMRKISAVNHGMVLRALSQALEKTELAYLDLSDKVIDQYPELAVMGSCLLAVLMRENDVYVMNLGDSRAIVAQLEPNAKHEGENDIGSSSVGLVEDPAVSNGKSSLMPAEDPAEEAANLIALQLSTDHSTNIEEEVLRIKRDHPNDAQCIVNGRVKGRLKVTRAFGAGYLKEAKWNAALLEMFRNEFVGTEPYISCVPSLCHYKIGSRDQFLVLSSDGLYQYLSNQEVVSLVANFLQNNQDGDPAQHLIEELLARAAKKAGMGFHELLDIPHGDRRKYHDDVTVMVISLEGRIWKSSGKYP